MAKFSILSDKKQGTATLYFRVHRNNPPINWRFNSQVQVDIKKWNDANKSADKFISFSATEYGKDIVGKLNAISKEVDDIMNSTTFSKDRIEKAIENIVYIDEINRKKKAIELQEKEMQMKRTNVVNAFNEFYKGISTGLIRHDGETYKAGSLKVWREFGKYVTEFCKGKTVTFDSIDVSMADRFTQFLEVKKGLMAKTVRKHIICMRKLCNYFAEKGVNHNAVSLKVWKEPKVCDEQMRAATYLNADELQALYDMQLTGEKEKVRDMFVLGTLLCQRYSDYMNLYADNFNTPLPDGSMCCRLTQKKTGAKVVVPLYDGRMNEICSKYGYNFPHVSDIQLQGFNRYLKLVMKELALSVPSLNESFVTVLTAGEKSKEKKYMDSHNGMFLYDRNDRGQVTRPKWDIITGHSARRSGITQLYERHALSTRQIMNISGHSTETIFEHYIKTGADDEAMSTAKALKQN